MERMRARRLVFRATPRQIPAMNPRSAWGSRTSPMRLKTRKKTSCARSSRSAPGPKYAPTSRDTERRILRPDAETGAGVSRAGSRHQGGVGFVGTGADRGDTVAGGVHTCFRLLYGRVQKRGVLHAHAVDHRRVVSHARRISPGAESQMRRLRRPTTDPRRATGSSAHDTTSSGGPPRRRAKAASSTSRVPPRPFRSGSRRRATARSPGHKNCWWSRSSSPLGSRSRCRRRRRRSRSPKWSVH